MVERATVDPFAPARLGPRALRNRLLEAATFAGMVVGNLVSERLVDFDRPGTSGHDLGAIFSLWDRARRRLATDPALPLAPLGVPRHVGSSPLGLGRSAGRALASEERPGHGGSGLYKQA